MATYVEKWVEEQAKLFHPDKIHWCDGSDEEAHWIVEKGMTDEKINGKPVFYDLNRQLWKNCIYHRSHPTDVARTEHLTFVCHKDKEFAGPNNNWMPPAEAKSLLTRLSTGSMRGRTMYVLPYMMGHPDSPYSKPCIQLTDISYVAVSMRIMTRMGKFVLDKIGNGENFVKGLHSVGDFSPERRFIMHFPEENLVWSIGSGYGGNALLGKKCFSLRIASYQGFIEGWLAEHMMIIGVQDPQGNVTYITAAFPSACGKTNLAMMEPALPGYKIWTLGDDIAWLHIGPDGRLWAINPEAGFFGVAPGTSMSTNPNMMRTVKAGTFYPTIFTNTALNPATNEPWWEGLDGQIPEHLLDWQGKPWTPASGSPAAHPNSRFTVSIFQAPTLSPEYDNPHGVPISAILFGGKRTKLLPLVFESLNWQNGVFAGVKMGSETTAAAAGQVGILRRDPMAMLPFCGYNMGDYFNHWLNIGKRLKCPPKMFYVNWFRKDENGKFMWPGFGENIRVLKWIIDRVHNRVPARETPIGLVPFCADIDTDGLNISKETLQKLFEVNLSEWEEELAEIKNFLLKFGLHIPPAIWQEYQILENQFRKK